jgi:hypothetical protein
VSINPQLEELDRVRQRAKPPLDRLRLTAYLLIGVGVLAFWVLAVYGLIALL